jgi:hypothetical protein
MIHLMEHPHSPELDAPEPQDARTLPAFAQLGRAQPAAEPTTYKELVEAVGVFLLNSGRHWTIEITTYWNEPAVARWCVWDGLHHYVGMSPQAAFAALRSGYAPLEAVNP